MLNCHLMHFKLLSLSCVYIINKGNECNKTSVMYIFAIFLLRIVVRNVFPWVGGCNLNQLVKKSRHYEQQIYVFKSRKHLPRFVENRRLWFLIAKGGVWLTSHNKQDPITSLKARLSDSLIGNMDMACIWFLNFFYFLINLRRKHWNTLCTKWFIQRKAI